MPAPIQQRYNAKARGSVAGGSHKKRKGPRAAVADDVSVSALPILEHDEGRGKMSAKKRKRFDSFVVRIRVSKDLHIWWLRRRKLAVKEIENRRTISNSSATRQSRPKLEH